MLAADLGDGTDDPRATAPDLLRRALAGLPQRARRSGRVALRAGVGYFAGQVARAAHEERIASLPAARNAVNRGGPVQQHRDRQRPLRRVVAAVAAGVAVRSPMAGCLIAARFPRTRPACRRPAGWPGQDPQWAPLTQ